MPHTNTPPVRTASVDTPAGPQAAIAASLAARGWPSGRLAAEGLAELAHAVARLDGLWRPLLRHDPVERFYARLHRTDDVEVWLLGWEVGQHTGIHDHGGSHGAFTVVEGALAEDHTARRRRGPLRRRVHREGEGAAFGTAYVHDLANLGPGVATSVHAYSPPLDVMTFYALHDGLPAVAEHVTVNGPDPGLPDVAAVVERGVHTDPAAPLPTRRAS